MQLPYWVQTVQALGPSLVAVVVGFVAGYVAYRQFRASRDKLRLDLFEKRYAVYQEVRKVLATTLQEGTVTYDDVTSFYRKVHGSEFLFGSEVEAFIERVREKLNNLAYHEGQIRAFNDGTLQNEAQYQKSVDAAYNRTLEVQHLLMTESRPIFENYLSFSHLK